MEILMFKNSSILIILIIKLSVFIHVNNYLICVCPSFAMILFSWTVVYHLSYSEGVFKYTV